MLEKAEGILLNKLIHRPASHLETRHPQRFQDNLSRVDVGWSFLNEPSNNLDPSRFPEVFTWIQDTSLSHLMTTDDTTSYDASREFSKYYDYVKDFLKLLLLLIHVTSGLPAQGTELTRLKIFNDGFTRQNFYIIHDRVVAIALEGNKSEGVTETPKVIARYLPVRVSQLFISYAADVMPFVQLCRTVQGSLPSSPCSYLWHTIDGKAWTTDLVSDILCTQATQHLSIPITVASWRHIAIALDQQITQWIQKKDQNSPSTQINHTFQAGHVPHIEEHNYALQMDQLHGVFNATLLAFRRVSLLTHRMYNLGDLSDFPEASANLVSSSSTPAIITSTLKKALTPLIHCFDSQDKVLGQLIPQKRRHSPNLSEDFHDSKAQSPSRPFHKEKPDIFKGLQDIFQDSHAQFRSPEQQEAITEVMNSLPHLLICLPTAGGKSLAIMMSGHFYRSYVTMVFVPFKALREDLCVRLRDIGIQSIVYTGNSHNEASVIFVTPEAMDTHQAHFQGFVHSLISQNRLARIFFDECHTFITDSIYRHAMQTVTNWLRENFLDIPLVFMTATLPSHLETQFRKTVLPTPTTPLKIVKGLSLRRNIAHQVQVLPLSTHLDFLQSLLQDPHRHKERTLICTMSIDICNHLAQSLQLPAYTSKLSALEQEIILKNFQDGLTLAVVCTSGFGTGIDVPNITIVVHYQGAYGLINMFQQAGRAGRRQEPSQSIMLLEFQPTLTAHPTVDDEALHHYICTRECRQAVLAAYFDGSFRRNCLNLPSPCDNCQRSTSESQRSDITSDIVSTQSAFKASSGLAATPYRIPQQSILQGAKAFKSLDTFTLQNSLSSSLPVPLESPSTRLSLSHAPKIPTFTQSSSTSPVFPPRSSESHSLYHTNIESNLIIAVTQPPVQNQDSIRAKNLKQRQVSRYLPTLKKVSCITCHLYGLGMTHNHTWETCPKGSWFQEKTQIRISAALRDQKHPQLSGTRCYSCWIPKYYLGSHDMGGQCIYHDQVLLYVLLAMNLHSYQPILWKHLGPDYTTLSPDNLGALLVRPSAVEEDILVMITIFVEIILDLITNVKL